MSFEKFGLLPAILASVEKQGYTQPTPIQEKSIPVILEGRDILAGAQTGTGKTAAFTLPVLQRLSVNVKSRHLPRALVLTPTRELAAQVGESVITYGSELDIRSTTIFGGVSINPQKKRLRRGVDIVIGTPGRLLDLIDQGELKLSKIEILVLDEADRMLDMGFIHDIRKIISLTPEKRQTLFFSATYSKAIKRLADKILVDPVEVGVAKRNSAAEGVKQSAYMVPKSRKRELLSHLIKEGDWKQVLVFTRTKHGANQLSKQLAQDGISTAAIHSNKSQGARTRALAEFKAGDVSVLVATDIAARGLDIEELPHVVNYELPNVPEDYIHRIGRTGRAGRLGEAVSLVAPSEVKYFKAIEKLLKKSIYVNRNHDFGEEIRRRDSEREERGRSRNRKSRNRGSVRRRKSSAKREPLTREQRRKI